MILFLIFLSAINAILADETLVIDSNKYALVKPLPKSGDYVWNLKTCNSCKMVVTCTRLENYDCYDFEVTITENNEYPKYPCSDSRRSRIAQLEGNEATITVENYGDYIPVVCNITATEPYTDTVLESVESDEDGKPVSEKPTCPCGWTNKEDSRIIGGKETLPNEYPFAVLFGEAGSLTCGGTIVSAFHVITAAHCVENLATEYLVVTGEHLQGGGGKQIDDRQTIPVKKVIVHEKFDLPSYKYDIALAYLERKIVISNLVGPACMPQGKIDLEGERLKVMGWGRVMYDGHVSQVLKKTYLKALNLDICRLIYPATMVGETQICAYNRGTDACQGDSGGPLVWLNRKTNMYTLVGIVSMGYRCNTTSPGVYTDVSAFTNWIKEKITETHPNELCY